MYQGKVATVLPSFGLVLPLNSGLWLALSIMWLKSQNLQAPIKDKSGIVWHFRVWSDFENHISVQRIFFWDESKKETGIIEFRDDQALHVRKIKQRMRKIVSSPEYRKKYICQLEFPVERKY